MTEYRLAKPEEWEDCIELANYVFSMAHRCLLYTSDAADEL